MLGVSAVVKNLVDVGGTLVPNDPLRVHTRGYLAESTTCDSVPERQVETSLSFN